MKAIFKRELKSYFDSPIAYIFIVVFLLINCGLYMSSFFLIGRLEVRAFFSFLPFVLIVFIPAITMRLWAEEKRMGTYELILTLPVKTSQIVLGKFFAGLVFYTVALAGTLSIPLVVWLLGGTDPGPILGGYIGSVMLGMFFLSVGLFISGFCKDQIIAFILAMVASFLFFMLGTDYIASQLDGWTGVFALGTVLKKYIGMTSHFGSVEKGVIDLRDAYYFVSMTGLFLFLNILFMEGRMKKGAGKRFATAAVITFAVIFFTNIVMAGFSGFRFDLTEGKIYTVSEASRSILSRLAVPVRVTLYITPVEKMPSAMKNLQRDIIDKLEEFKLASSGNLTYDVFDPTADPKLTEKVTAKGISPFQVQSVERDEIGVKVVYSAMSISYLDKKEEIIPAVHIENFSNLEYDLVSKIYKVASDRRAKIAIFAKDNQIDPALAQLYMQMGRPIPDNEPKFRSIAEILREEGYDVVTTGITKDNPVPPDVTTLLVLSPERLNERQRYEISRLVTEGKNVIFAIQNYRYNYSPIGQRGMEVTPVPVFPDVNQLLQSWGVTVSNDLLMDNNMETLSVPARQNILGLFNAMVSTPVKVPTQIKVISQTMNKDVSITNNLSVLLYIWGSALKLDKPEGLESRILLTSSPESWEVPAKSENLTLEDITPPKEFKGSLPLAVMISGKFKDPYQNAQVPQWPEDEGVPSGATAGTAASAPAKIIVIGAGDMFNDDFIRAGSNGLFLLNSVDAVSLGDELINIRGKQQVINMIPKTSPAEKFWLKIIGTLLTPVIIISAGLIRYFIRKRTISTYMLEV